MNPLIRVDFFIFRKGDIMYTRKFGKDFYETAKDIIGDKTPLSADCGLVCDKACCKGDENTGMILFPGESTEFRTIEKYGVRLCVCGGECNRANRPLSCMIFPFFPYMDENGRIKAVIDPRGVGVCPLVSHSEEVAFNKAFIRRASKLGRFLKKDPECRKFLYETSREIDKLNLFMK